MDEMNVNSLGDSMLMIREKTNLNSSGLNDSFCFRQVKTDPLKELKIGPRMEAYGWCGHLRRVPVHTVCFCCAVTAEPSWIIHIRH